MRPRSFIQRPLQAENQRPRIQKSEGSIPPMSVKIDDLLRVCSKSWRIRSAPQGRRLPVMRIGGELHPVADAPRLKPEDTLDMAVVMMSNRQKQRFKEASEVDIGTGSAGLVISRQHLSATRDREHCLARHPDQTKNSGELGIAAGDRAHHGGTSRINSVQVQPVQQIDNLAAMIDRIMRLQGHIVTIEDHRVLHRDKLLLLRNAK